jgi:Chaperone of endosialidase
MRIYNAQGLPKVSTAAVLADGDKGDITVGSGGTTLTIDPKAVTYPKIQDVSASSRVLGRITSGAGVLEELSGTQLTTLLDVFTSTTKGLVPASGGGTGNFLRADGAFAVPPGTMSLADPSGLIGLTAVNGVATTALRSDARHAIDQGIAPVWMGPHTFTHSQTAAGISAINIRSAIPGMVLQETIASANNKLWYQWASGERLNFVVANDAITVTTEWMTVDRTGTAIDSVTFPNGPVIANARVRTPVLESVDASKSITFDPVGYGTVRVTGTTGGYAGYQINDGTLNPTFFCAGGNAGTFIVGDGKFLLYRGSSATAFSDYTLSAAGFNSGSARALKTITGVISNAAVILRQLKPIKYRLKADPAREQAGLVAEDVHAVCEWLSDGKRIAYDRLAILLLQAWQEEHAAVNQLKEKV